MPRSLLCFFPFFKSNNNMSWRTFHSRTYPILYLLCGIGEHVLCNPTPTPSTFPSFQAIDHPAGMGPFVSISEGLSRGIARVTHCVFLSFNRNSQNAPRVVISIHPLLRGPRLPNGGPTASRPSLVCVPESDRVRAGDTPATIPCVTLGLVTWPPAALMSSTPVCFVVRTK